ncbi:tetrapyrrole methylase [Zopfochytrium polystomum]|nr:tetrapyrrole methylase [Zopfochytrium polystomum]
MLVVRRLPARPSSSPASPIPARRRRRWPSPVPPPTLVLESGESLHHRRHATATPLDPRDCIRSLVDDLGAAVSLKAAAEFKDVITLPAAQTALLTVNSSIVREAHERGLPICVLGQPLLSDFDFVLPPSARRSEDTECTNLLDGPSSKRHRFSNPSDDHDEVGQRLHTLDYESATGSSRPIGKRGGSPFAISPSSWGGPTSPELEELTRSSKPAATCLTIRAVNAIQSATLIIADRLVLAPSSSPTYPPSTPILTARKLPGRAPEAQSEIHDWIEAALKLGHVVVRLKGGDPHVFGRGGEEILRVRERWFAVRGDQHRWQLGIPVSHRGVADQILVLTGTRENGSRPTVPPYCPSRTTIDTRQTCPRLLSRRLFVWRTSVQRVVRGRISDITSKVKELGIKAHATLVVGSVVDVLSEQHVALY